MTSKRAMSGISVEEQIKAIHQSQGLLEEIAHGKIGPTAQPSVTPLMSVPSQPMASLAPPPPPSLMSKPAVAVNLAPPVIPPSGMPFGMSVQQSGVHQFDTLADDLPASKRLKTGEDNLVPEKDFLDIHEANGPVKFHVQLPHVPDKPEWNLNGQTISLVLPLTETVATIKNKLMDQLNMPIAKQKLQLDVSILLFIVSVVLTFLRTICPLIVDFFKYFVRYSLKVDKKTPDLDDSLKIKTSLISLSAIRI